ncbi:unnamed protein product [Adineta steineri]|uniref:Uncharacterized protein n=1 Tax=Adineta steineri TaxID=433720 RepID=A0A819TIQ3_9BILA|nr:unnamed protein product [Adineta steineri]CAF4077897.1 unnamed protein product [Adineta steineri]
MTMPHPESFSIADHLTVRDQNSNKLLYQPSVYFVYLPCDSAVCSLHDWWMQDYPPLDDQRVMCDDIEYGADELGVLLLGGCEVPAWWTGSVLDIAESRRLVKGQSATTLQVAIAAVAAVIYALRHPQEGVRFPEQINTDEILTISMPFLGDWVSQPINWPIKQQDSDKLDKKSLTTAVNGDVDHDDQWQFNAFCTNLMAP